MNLLESKKRLYGLQSLEKNWDGVEAEAPNQVSIDNADWCLSFMFPLMPDRIAPSVEGGVGMTWFRSAKDLMIYLECNNEGVVAASFSGKNVDYEFYDASEMGIIPFTNKLKEVLRG